MVMLALEAVNTTVLVAMRLGTIFLFTPIIALRQLPSTTRLLLLFISSGLLVSTLELTSNFNSSISLAFATITEFANSLILSMSLQAVAQIFSIAGLLIDTQMGLNAAAIFNPHEHTHDPLTSRLLSILACWFFYILSGPHRLLQVIAASFIGIPPGHFITHGFLPLIKQFGLMFSLAVMFAGPIMFALLTVDLGICIFTRNMPQMSVYFLSIPFKILLGVFLLYSLLPLFQNSINHTLTNAIMTLRTVCL